QAPGFTRARVAVGTTLAQMGRHDDALEVLNLVLAYAPDDVETLYAAAYANARLGNKDMAKSLLGILFSSSSREKEIIDKARLLNTLLEQNIPLDSPVAP
ncbi:MAG: hypothetical protein IH969_05830, partial [Candidatus Krumholzibacteriota bacterium]|nr:hypothetical protein [Candidatus Krumholzibacteriota bacterium]